MKSQSLCFAIAVNLAVAAVASATLVTDEHLESGFTVSNSDLLQTNLLGSPVTTGNFQQEGVPGETVLRDGQFGPLGGQQGATAGEGESVIYTLDTSSASLGYKITDVDTFAGWSYGRFGQHYDVSFHHVGDAPGSFVDQLSVTYVPDPATPGGNYSTAVYFSDPSGLSTGVDQVKFVFHDVNNSWATGYAGYRELDVIGSPIPEPSTLISLGLGALGLFAVARRRRSA